MAEDWNDMTLVELVNRVVDRGVLLGGEITISVADIDLLHIDLRVLLTSADRMHRLSMGGVVSPGAHPPKVSP